MSNKGGQMLWGEGGGVVFPADWERTEGHLDLNHPSELWVVMCFVSVAQGPALMPVSPGRWVGGQEAETSPAMAAGGPSHVWALLPTSSEM